MNAVRFIEKLIVRVNIFVMVVSLAVMIALGFLQIILRNFFDSGLPWADILIRNLVLWAGFSGAVVTTSKGQHIAIGVLANFIPMAGKRIVHVLVSVSSALVCLFLTAASIRFVVSEKEMGGFLVGNIPMWVSELIVPVTFFFLFCQFVLEAFEKPHEEAAPI